MLISINICSGIYKITNTVNSKVYIGCSSYIPERWMYHRFYLQLGRHSNYKLQRDWKDYGPDSFMFSLVQYVHDSKQLPIIEREIIHQYADAGEIYNIKV